MNNAIEKAKVAFTHMGKVAIILVALTIGFISGEIYHRVTETAKDKVPMDSKEVHQLKTTSIAINERAELLIIDRKTGNYEIYQDSIGKVIFNLYASQMVIDANKK